MSFVSIEDIAQTSPERSVSGLLADKFIADTKQLETALTSQLSPLSIALKPSDERSISPDIVLSSPLSPEMIPEI